MTIHIPWWLRVVILLYLSVDIFATSLLIVEKFKQIRLHRKFRKGFLWKS